VSKYKYKFEFYTDKTAAKSSFTKLPIIGGRRLPDFNASVLQTQDLTEADLLNIDLDNRWLNYPFLTSTLADPTLQNAKPSITETISTGGTHPCGGYIIWKSKFGGWMSWGFDIQTETDNQNYSGNIESGMFESTKDIGGSPSLPPNYTQVSVSYSRTLKALSLTRDELEAVRGIKGSPAVFYMKSSSGELELMRLSSATVPLSSLANGGDFTVTLSSISKSILKTR